jgi:hypothetical protein
VVTSTVLRDMISTGRIGACFGTLGQKLSGRFFLIDWFYPFLVKLSTCLVFVPWQLMDETGLEVADNGSHNSSVVARFMDLDELVVRREALV